MDTKKLRQKILDLAIRGKLVPQDPNDEPASVLLERIRTEKERLIKEGKIKRSKKSAADDEIEAPFEIPKSWEWTTIEDIGESNIGLTYKPSDVTAQGVPVYRSNNIKNRNIDLTDIVRVKTEILEKQFLHEGDLLICARNGSRNLVGKCAIIKHLEEPTSFGAFMAVCRSEYNNWIFLLLNSKYFNSYLDDSNSTAINQVTQKMLLAFQVPFPPVEEQKRIYEEVYKWFSIIDILEKENTDIQTSINSAKSKILDLAIHGKLVPQDPNDEPATELLKRINPKFEPCDAELFTNLPSSWQVCSVKDVFQINPKINISDNLEAAFVPMANIEDQYDNSFVFESRKWGDIKRGYTHFQDGDIAVAKISPCLENRKSVVFENLPNGIGAGTTELNIFRSEIVTPLYGLYFFKSNYFISNCVGTFNGVVGQQRVATKIVEEIIFPLPPFAEQLRIVAKIEELFAILDSIKESLK